MSTPPRAINLIRPLTYSMAFPKPLTPRYCYTNYAHGECALDSTFCAPCLYRMAVSQHSTYPLVRPCAGCGRHFVYRCAITIFCQACQEVYATTTGGLTVEYLQSNVPNVLRTELPNSENCEDGHRIATLRLFRHDGTGEERPICIIRSSREVGAPVRYAIVRLNGGPDKLTCCGRLTEEQTYWVDTIDDKIIANPKGAYTPNRYQKPLEGVRAFIVDDQEPRYE